MTWFTSIAAEFVPKVGRGFGALQEEGHVNALVGGVDAVLVQADGDEDQRGAQNVGQVGLRAAAAFPGEEEDLLTERPLHAARSPAATAGESIGEKHGRTPGPSHVTKISTPSGV